MYNYLIYGGEQSPLGEYDWRYTRIFLAEKFPGWPLHYIDGLSERDVIDIIAVLNGTARARKTRQHK